MESKFPTEEQEEEPGLGRETYAPRQSSSQRRNETLWPSWDMLQRQRPRAGASLGTELKAALDNWDLWRRRVRQLEREQQNLRRDLAAPAHEPENERYRQYLHFVEDELARITSDLALRRRQLPALHTDLEALATRLQATLAEGYRPTRSFAWRPSRF